MNINLATTDSESSDFGSNIIKTFFFLNNYDVDKILFDSRLSSGRASLIIWSSSANTNRFDLMELVSIYWLSCLVMIIMPINLGLQYIV